MTITATALPPLPEQPAGVPWPTADWPTGELPPTLNRAAFEALVEAAFGQTVTEDLGESHALVIVQGGRLVFERYAGAGAVDATEPSWSMAKSMTHALVGLLALDGRIDIHAPADVPEWKGAGDPRGAITLDQLLRMSSGLRFVEDYVPEHPSDVIEMLFGAGKDDVAHFAAMFPLEHPPGSFWSYASGTSNIVARCAAQAQGGDFPGFMQQRLFGPLGMTSATPRFDATGTFIGSSYCFCTPRDFARFGLLYLRDGIWEGRRLLPEGWVDYARTPTPQPADTIDGPYGAHWWLDTVGPGTFSANGYAGQFIVLIPQQDLILVRNGNTPLERKDALKAWMRNLAACFG